MATTLSADDAFALVLVREAADGPAPLRPDAAGLPALAAACHRRIDADPALARLWRARAWFQGRWPGAWLAVPMALFGTILTGLAADGTLNVLTPPLIGLVLWQWLAFLAIALRGRAALHGLRGGLRGALAALARRVPTLAGDAALGGAVARRWAGIAGPLLAARVAATLHLGAAAFAAGAVAGLYLDGLGVEYRATWESTFLGAAAVRDVLAVLLTPAALLTGLALPDVDGVARMMTTPEPAARWIHLWAATLGLWAVLPRTLLAAAALRRAGGPVRWDPDDPWLARQLAAASGDVVHLRAQPVGYRPATTGWERLQARAERDWGPAARLDRAAPMPWDADGAAVDPAGAERVLLLFSPVQIPESDVHGPFLDALEARVPVTVVLDAADWAAEPDRRRQRLDAWRRMLDARGTAHFVLDDS